MWKVFWGPKNGQIGFWPGQKIKNQKLSFSSFLTLKNFVKPLKIWSRKQLRIFFGGLVPQK